MVSDYWQTQDGRRIAVKDMDDRHLANTIAMLERNASRYKETMLGNLYAMEGGLQGEQAQYDIGRDISRLEEMDVQEFLEEAIPVYKTMKWHLSRRRLTSVKKG